MNVFELLDAIEMKKTEIRNLVEANKLDDAETAKIELMEMQDKLNNFRNQAKADPVHDASVDAVDTANSAEEEEEHGEAEEAEQEPEIEATEDEEAENKETEEIEEIENKGGNNMPTMIKVAEQENNAVKLFADAARNGFRTNALTEGTKADGGYTVPEDIQTRINELKEAKFNLENLVSVESVSAPTGRRVYKARGKHAGFTNVAEIGNYTKKDEPKFEAIEYNVKKYGGFFVMSEELLEDSDANIMSVLTQWIADEDVATRNTAILAALNEKPQTDLANLDGIKKAINVTLGSAFAGATSIVTNDDGLNYLDTLTDGNGQYLLKPSLDQDSPMSMTLAVGARRIPIEAVPNDVLETKANKIPFVIGDLKTAVKMFDKKQVTIATSNDASVTGFNAFEQGLTLIKATERFDCKVVDKNAYVNGYITAE